MSVFWTWVCFEIYIIISMHHVIFSEIFEEFRSKFSLLNGKKTRQKLIFFFNIYYSLKINVILIKVCKNATNNIYKCVINFNMICYTAWARELKVFFLFFNLFLWLSGFGDKVSREKCWKKYTFYLSEIQEQFIWYLWRHLIKNFINEIGLHIFVHSCNFMHKLIC